MNASAKRKEQLPEKLFKNPAACLSTFDKQNSVLAHVCGLSLRYKQWLSLSDSSVCVIERNRKIIAVHGKELNNLRVRNVRSPNK